MWLNGRMLPNMYKARGLIPALHKTKNFSIFRLPLLVISNPMEVSKSSESPTFHNSSSGASETEDRM